jgi:GNAT superfamily N-acetyltransferase
MNDRVESGLAVRIAIAADLPALQQVYSAASLSNAGNAPMLLARPEFLVFTGDGIAAGRTLVAVAGPPGTDRVVGFATVTAGQDDDPELEDLFVDPDWHRRGIARRLVWQVADTAREAGHRRLWVTGNMRWPSTWPSDSSRSVRSPPRWAVVYACTSTLGRPDGWPLLVARPARAVGGR